MIQTYDFVHWMKISKFNIRVILILFLIIWIRLMFIDILNTTTSCTNVKKMDINKNAHNITNRTIENGRDILIFNSLITPLKSKVNIYLTLCGFKWGLKSFTYFCSGWLMLPTNGNVVCSLIPSLLQIYSFFHKTH